MSFSFELSFHCAPAFQASRSDGSEKVLSCSCSRTTTRWGKDLPVTALSPASPPQNPRPSPLVSAHIPPAVNPASPGDPTSPPQTKASPVLPDLAKPPVLAEPDLAKPSVLEEPAIPPPVKAGSPDGPSSPTEAQQNSRRSRSASHRADRGSPPARRRDHRDRRPESRERYIRAPNSIKLGKGADRSPPGPCAPGILVYYEYGVLQRPNAYILHVQTARMNFSRGHSA